MVSTALLRRTLLGAVVALGLALLALSLQGMTSLDGQLSTAAERSAPAHSLPVNDDDRDCPWKDRAPARGPARGTGFEA